MASGLKALAISFTLLVLLGGSHAMAQCEVNAGANITVCEGELVTLGGNPTIEDGGPGATVSWSNGLGNDENPEITATTTTTYTVTLTDGGCTDTDQITVTVLPAPDPGFNFGPNSACAGLPVTFSNTTTNCPGCTYNWDFDNPESGASNTSTSNNVVHTFVAVGNGTEVFNVTLTAEAANGCTASITIPVTVNQSPEAVLTEDVDFTQCLGINSFEAWVYDASSPALNSSYSIDWGDGTPVWTGGTPPNALIHTYNGLDLFDLVYTVTGTNGCQDSETYVVTNISNPAIGAANPGNTLQCGPVEMCFPLSNYSNNHPSTVYIVDFGDGTPAQTFPHPPPLEVCHTYDQSSCANVPSFFTFSIEANNNCPTSSVATISPIQVFTPPVAQFYADPEPGCVNIPVTFVNTSITGYNLNCNGNASFVWDFGDGSPTVTSNSFGNQSHAYTAPGTYTVTLTATNAGNPALGCGTTDFSLDVCIETPPSPQFTLSENIGCLPLLSAVDNTSDNGIPCSLSRNWIIEYADDPCAPNTGAFSYQSGTNASSLEPVFLFQSVGTYTVTLEMVNACGVFQDVEVVQVNTVPELALNLLPNICAGSSVNPTALIDNCNEPITSYSWSFPGGAPGTSASQNPGSVNYANAGNFNVSLTATNACGPSTVSTPVVVEAAPVITLVSNTSDDEICNGQQAILTASGASSYSWTPAPGLVSTNGAQATVAPSSDQTYTVTGYTPAGCPGTASITIDVNPLPVPVAASNYTICAGESVVIGANVSGGTPPINSYSWTPSATLDQSNIPNPTATPAITTNYTVTVTDSEGCQGSGTVPVTVNPLPVVNAGPDISLCDQPVPEILTGYAPTTGGTGVWTGTGISDPSGEFTPPGVGTYTLTYTFTNANGCVNSDQIEIDVIAPTQADAGPDLSFCQSAVPVQLTGSGTWSGSNVTPGGQFTPSSPGIYNLTYSEGVGSCLTSDQLQIEVFELPQVTASTDETICDGDSVQLGVDVVGGASPYLSAQWNNPGSLSDPLVADPYASPVSTTTYTYTVTDQNNCVAQDAQQVTVLPSPVVEAGPNLSLCDQPIPEVLTGFSPTVGGTGVWTGANITDPSGEFTPNGSGSFVVTYTFTDSNGCSASDSLTITVVDPTAANAGPDLSLCLNEPAVQLAAGGTWSGTNVTPGGLFTPSQTGSYILDFSIGSGTCESTDQLEITVNELPTANAGLDVTICEGDEVQLNANGVTSNPPIVLYSWSGGPGLSATNVSDPIASPVVTTVYNLTVVDAAGCSDSDQINVNVNPLPVVNAGSDLILCDQPIEETLAGFSPLSGPGGAGEWSGTGISDPSGVFLSPGIGTYTLYYTFTDLVGCVNLDSIEVEVIAPQIADAGPDLALCPNELPVQLTGFAPQAGGLWSGPGLLDPVAGIIDPALIPQGLNTLYFEYGQGTCYSLDSIEVEIYALPLLEAGADEEVCGNELPFDFSGFDPPLGTWEGTGIIDASIGTFDPSVGAGSYDLIYFFTDPNTGCADTVNKVVTVHPVPIADFVLDPAGCTNFNLDITNQSSGATTYEWDFGDNGTSVAASPIYTINDPGNYVVELIALNQFSCSDTTSAPVEVIDPPVANLTITPDQGCAPHEVTFENNAVGQYLSFEWDLDVTTSTDTVPDPIIYQQEDDVADYFISLTATNYCGSSIAVDTVIVFPQPVAGFGTNLDVFCSPFTVEFNNTSVGNPDVWLWEFGDGSTSSVEEPGTHIYFTDSVATDYDILLVTTNECGIDSAWYTITVLPNTVTAFFNTNITTGCAPLEVEFTDFSEGGTVITYDFGNNDITDEPNPIHVFTEPGDYEVFQYVNNGCSFDTTFIEITVLPGPDLAFTTSEPSVCENTPVQFLNQSTGVSDVSWDFGDGEQSEEANPFHSFPDGGQYTVTLFGTSSLNECPGQIQQVYSVNSAPDASLTLDEQVGCSPFTVNFENTTQGGLFYSWNFGDGNTSGASDPVHTFLNDTEDPVSYLVTMIAENIQLCADTAYINVVVSPVPVAQFSLPSEGSCDQSVLLEFNNNSYNANDYQWDLGQFGNSTMFEPSVVINGTGTYTFELEASNSYGCSDTHEESFSIYELPEASFSANPLQGCRPLMVQFNSSGSDLATEYVWNFGDGQTSIAANPAHLYMLHGWFDVSLEVISADGCRDTLQLNDYVEVYPLPIANFILTPSETDLLEPLVQFFDASIGAQEWYWTFGDGAVSFDQNVTHIYQESGYFPVNLTVVNQYGCEDSRADAVVIEEVNNVYVPNAFTPDGDGTNDVFVPVLLGSELLFYKFQIFDRWGELIFESEERDEPWLGNYKGGDYYVKDDVYVWQLTVHWKGSGEAKVYRGHVTMIR